MLVRARVCCVSVCLYVYMCVCVIVFTLSLFRFLNSPSSFSLFDLILVEQV